MINLIKPVKCQIGISWDPNRMILVDIDCAREGGRESIYATPTGMTEQRWTVDQSPASLGKDPEIDPYRNIARDIIEYATTGRRQKRMGIDKLTHGPIAGVGQLVALSDMLRAMHGEPLILASEG